MRKLSKKILAVLAALVVVLITMPVDVLAMPAASTHSLTTTFAGDNSQYGIVVDLNVTGPDPVVVDGFDISLLPGDHAVSVYVRNGSYIGAELSSEGWTLVGTQTVTSTGRSTPTSLDIGGIVLEPGQTYGFLFYSTAYVGYSTASDTYSDSNLTISPGKGLGGLFQGTVYADRTWNGGIYYHIAHAITASASSGGTIAPNGVTYVASGSSLAYSITPENGYRISTVLADGVEQGPVSGYTFTNVQAAHTITASFETLPVIHDNIGTSFSQYAVTPFSSPFTGSGTATVTIHADNAKFVRLLLNSSTVDSSNYTVTQGSTVISLKESYLKTFANGTYTLRAEFTDGYAELPIVIDTIPESAIDTNVSIPETGDTSSTALCLSLSLISLGGIFIAAYVSKRKTK